MAAPQGENNSKVGNIKSELENQEEDFKDISADFGDYDTSIDEVLERAHGAVDGSSKQSVQELFELGEQAKGILGGLSEKAGQCAEQIAGIRERL